MGEFKMDILTVERLRKGEAKRTKVRNQETEKKERFMREIVINIVKNIESEVLNQRF